MTLPLRAPRPAVWATGILEHLLKQLIKLLDWLMTFPSSFRLKCSANLNRRDTRSTPEETSQQTSGHVNDELWSDNVVVSHAGRVFIEGFIWFITSKFPQCYFKRIWFLHTKKMTVILKEIQRNWSWKGKQKHREMNTGGRRLMQDREESGRRERSDDKVTANLRKTFWICYTPTRWINCHLPSRLPWKMNFLRGERKQHVVMRFLLSALLVHRCDEPRHAEINNQSLTDSWTSTQCWTEQTNQRREKQKQCSNLFKITLKIVCNYRKRESDCFILAPCHGQ